MSILGKKTSFISNWEISKKPFKNTFSVKQEGTIMRKYCSVTGTKIYAVTARVCYMVWFKKCQKNFPMVISLEIEA